MKTRILSLLTLVSLAGCAVAAAAEPPPVLPNGLTLVQKSEADLVYVRPGADLASYTKVVLIEPTIAFRKNWKNDINDDRYMDRITDDDMAKMIENGKKLLIEEFGKELKKGGYTFADKPGAGVLAIQPAILELDVYAPDPNRMMGVWTKTYTDGAGSAIMEIKLYDSKTGQLLVDAIDGAGGGNNSPYSWRTQRTQVTNEMDARYAFASWARMLVDGLKKTRDAAAAKKAP